MKSLNFLYLIILKLLILWYSKTDYIQIYNNIILIKIKFYYLVDITKFVFLYILSNMINHTR